MAGKPKEKSSTPTPTSAHVHIPTPGRSSRVKATVRGVSGGPTTPPAGSGDLIGSPTNNSRGTSSLPMSSLPENMIPVYDHIDDGLIDVRELDSTPKNKVVKKGSQEVITKDFNEKLFDPGKLLDRIQKFYARYKDTIKKRLNGKGKSSLSSFIKDSYVDHFSSPQVGIGADRLLKIMKDYSELEGEIEKSLITENILEDMGYNLGEVISGEYKTKKASHVEDSEEDDESPEDLEVDYEKKIFDGGPRPKKYFVIEETIKTKILPIEEVDRGLKIEIKNFKQGSKTPGSIHILNTAEFESCKQFGCHKFSMLSLANALERSGEKSINPSNNTLFKVCCDNFNKEGCPQGREYDEMEKVIYGTALKAHNDKRAAHAQILAYRIDKAEKE